MAGKRHIICVYIDFGLPIWASFSRLRTSVFGLPTSILLLTFMSLSAPLFSQVYPVSTVTSITPPYPSSLDGFVDQAAGKINLQVVVNDITLTNYPVKLRLIIKSNAVTIVTSASYTTEPLYINGGEALVLGTADLSSYFRPENLDFNGYSKSQYMRTGHLPDGIYQLSFEVVDYARNFTISSAIPAFAYIFVNDPPILNTPQTSKQIDITGQQNIVFNWAFRHSPFSRSGFRPEYQLEIWEVYPDNLDPYAVVRSSQPLFTEKLTATSFVYNDNNPQLIPGRKYAWRVKAVDPEGIIPFKEDGNSEVRWFAYGTACDAPQLKAGKSGTSHLNLEWETAQLQQNFTIRYKPEQPADAPWYNSSSPYLSLKIDNLRPNTSYIVEVSGKCGAQESPFSNQLTLRTNLDLTFQCGNAGNIPAVTNQTPLLQLQKGNFIKAGDFEVEVYQVEGVNGIFYGKGYVLVPMFNFLKLDAVLDNIQVNTDFQLIGGSIRTIYDINNSLSANVTDIAKQLLSDTKTETNYFTEMDSSIAVNAGDSITSITVSGGQVRVETEQGEPKVVAIGTSKVVAITAPTGKQYVVDGSTNTVYSQGSPDGTAPKGGSNNLLNSDESNAKFQVSFLASDKQNYGFDSPNTNPPAGMYTEKTIAGKQVILPWKSVESGNFDKLNASITGTPADSVFFSRRSASMVMIASGVKETEKQLMVTGDGNNNEDELFAYYRAYTGDSVKKQEAFLAGALNLVSYDKEMVKMELVNVNGAVAPDAGFVQRELNAIYKQAVIDWNITQKSEKLMVDFGTGQVFDNADPDDDMDYTESEKLVIERFKDTASYDKDKIYLFFINEKTKDQNLKGYMPFNRNFGFIFVNNQKSEELIRTIAHEPGHGAFRLRHTFSEKNKYIEPKFATSNLMDYTNAEPMNKTALHKYQWDECHDWDLGMNWGEEEEEGEIKTIPGMLTLIRNSNLFGKKELDLQRDKCFKWALKNLKIGDKKLSYIHMTCSDEVDDQFPYDNFNNRENKYDNLLEDFDVSINPAEISKENLIGVKDKKKYVSYSFHELIIPKNNIELITETDKVLFRFVVSESESKDFEDYLFPTWEYLITKPELKPSEIALVRKGIESLAIEKRKNYYIELQKKVPYHNQRNNASIMTSKKTGEDMKIGDVMCNITSMAMALEMLGLENPCLPEISQFEDCIETKITYESSSQFSFKPLNDDFEYDDARESIDGRISALEEMYGDEIKCKGASFKVNKDTDKIKLFLKDKLESGYGVIASYGGHIIRIESCDDEGFVYDDPYGLYSIDDSKKTGKKRSWDDDNASKQEKGYGKDNIRKWSDFDVLTTSENFYIEYYFKNKKK